MWIRIRALRKSVQYASRGLRYTLQHEQNFRIQVVIAALVIVLMLVAGVRPLEAVALIFVITAVLVLEILNTVVEKFIDLLKPRLHHYSGIIKDMMAAGVTISAVGAVAVGTIIFWPYIFG